MRLRNGKTVGEADLAENSSMDTSSTQAEPGSPQHTNSFSTTHSASTLPPAAQAGPPTDAEQPQPQPQPQPREPGQLFHQHIPRPHEDFVLYPAADEEDYADGQAPQEQVPVQQAPHQQPPSLPSSSNPTAAGPSVQYNGHTQPDLQHNRNGSTSSAPTPQSPQISQPPRSLAPLETTGQEQPSEAASVRQWPDRGTPPWSHVLGVGAGHESPTERMYPPDRNYPDKIEEELDELEKKATDTHSHSDGTEKEEKQTKGKGRPKRGTKRRGTRSPSHGMNRQDKRPRGGGGNGYGVFVGMDSGM